MRARHIEGVCIGPAFLTVVDANIVFPGASLDYMELARLIRIGLTCRLEVRSIGGIKAPESEHSSERSHNPVISWGVVNAPMARR